MTFGINTFMAQSLQTILTLVVVDEAALGLDIKTQVCFIYCTHLNFLSYLNLTLRAIWVNSL